MVSYIEGTYVEPDYGRKHFQPGEPQSDKDCETCIYFDRDLAADHPCGLCYESEDKYEHQERGGEESDRLGLAEMDEQNYRVCDPDA